MPRRRISTTGAMPEPSFRFEPGAVHHLHVALGEQRLLLFVDPDAVGRAEVRCRQVQCVEIRDVREASGQLADDGDFLARLGGVRVHERRPARHETAATASSRSRVHDTANRGPVRPGAGRARRRASVCAARGSRRARPACAPSGATVRRRPRPSCTCRSWRAGRSRRRPRTPRRCRAPSPSSAPRWCRSASNSVVASRAAARSVAGVWAASIGQMRVRSHCMSGMSSA